MDASPSLWQVSRNRTLVNTDLSLDRAEVSISGNRGQKSVLRYAFIHGVVLRNYCMRKSTVGGVRYFPIFSKPQTG